MPNPGSDPFTQLALSQVDAYIAVHSEYSRQGVAQPGQGATNRVVFGRRGTETVVFKVFCQPERKQREVFAFQHWQPTGLIPRLLDDVDETMIVTSFLPGHYLHPSYYTDRAPVFRQACHEAGKAVGALTHVSLSAGDRAAFESRFYDGLGPLQAYLARILQLGRGIQAHDLDFRDPFWHDNLDLIEAQLPALYAQPRVLYHQDVSNLHVMDGRFVGFFDLEMCRVGCAEIQLASALNMMVRGSADWETFCRGWEAGAGAPLALEQRRATLAAYSALQWREISRYLSYDGTPGTGYEWASPADPVTYRASIQAAETILDI